jgi:hypothetical protein
MSTSGRGFRQIARSAALVALAMGVLSQLAPPSQASRTPVAQSRSVAGPAAPLRDLRFRPDDVRDMGDTYYSLERRSQRVTARFTDGVVAVDRLNDDSWSVEIQDQGGVYVGQMAVTGVGAGRYALGFNSPQDRLSTDIDNAMRPTADWAGLQAYMLWKEKGLRRSRGIERRGRFLRPKGAAPLDVEDAPIFLTAEFPNDITVTTHRRFKSVEYVRNTPAPYYVTSLAERGVTRGEMWWFPQTQTLEWKFPNLTSGQITPEGLLATPGGGWEFRPTMAWANIQAYAFFESHSRIAADKRAAERNKPTSAFRRAVDWLVPSLHADSIGCDGLHWLDGSIYRACCDQHDSCYATYACSQGSWIVDFANNSADWMCVGCNVQAIVCFATGGATGGGGGGGGGDNGGWGGGGGCVKWAGDYCEYPTDCCSGGCSENFCDGG